MQKEREYVLHVQRPAEHTASSLLQPRKSGTSPSVLTALATLTAMVGAACRQETCDPQPVKPVAVLKESDSMWDVADSEKGKSIIGKKITVTVNRDGASSQYTLQIERNEKNELLLIVNGSEYSNLDSINLLFANLPASTMIDDLTLDEQTIVFHSNLATGSISKDEIESGLAMIADHAQKGLISPLEVTLCVEMNFNNSACATTLATIYKQKPDGRFTIPFHFDPIGLHQKMAQNSLSGAKKHPLDLPSHIR